MKNQYFADYGDYQKFSLLKELKQEFSVLVHWMKTLDDTSTDGKHITYLQKPDLFRKHDPEIFDFLKEQIALKRDLDLYEQSKLAKGISFENSFIEDLEIRKETFSKIISKKANQKSDKSEIVLLDPDNGFEVASTNKKNLHKYVLFDEVLDILNSGKNVIVYQHFGRVNREEFIKKIFAKLESEIAKSKNTLDVAISFLKVKHSVYFLLFNKKDLKRLEKVITAFRGKW